MELLEAACEELEKNKRNWFAAAVYENGKIDCLRARRSGRLNNVYSISKNFTATAVGMLEYRNQLKISDLAKKYLAEYIPDSADPKWGIITLENLLSHTWGQGEGTLFERERFGTEYGGCTFFADAPPKGWGKNRAREIFAQKLPLAVGGEMRYSNASYYLLSLVAEKVTGKRLADWLREELFLPLDFRGYACGCCPEGHTLGATEMFFCAEDLVKLGALYLQNGVYNGKRFFAEDWAERAKTPRARSKNGEYGLGFWSYAGKAFYFASGAHGQLLVIDLPRRRAFALQSYDDGFDEREFLLKFFG